MHARRIRTYGATACLLFAQTQFWFKKCAAHMAMSEPPSINYKSNPNVQYGVEDYDYTSPLSSSGSDYPCKGELKYLGSQAAASVAAYQPGGQFTIKLDGDAVHGGGSCQASLSYDKGATFTVIKSWIGDCPHATGTDQTFTGQIPSNAPRAAEVIFAWTWFNEIGNREMYMNCAVVTIGSGGGRRRSIEPRILEHQIVERTAPDNSTCGSDSSSASPTSSSGSSSSAPLSPRALSGPTIFLANIGNGCATIANVDVVFPSPGAVIQYGGDPTKRANPTGTCNGRTFTGGAPSGSSAGGAGTGSSSSGSSTGTNAGTDATMGGSAMGGTMGANAGVQTAGHQGDCAYWMTQGYTCSRAALAFSNGKAEALLTILLLMATVGWHLSFLIH